MGVPATPVGSVPPLPPPPPPAPAGRPAPPEMLSVVAPLVVIAARNVFAPTENAIHEFGWMTSFEVAAATVEPPS